MPAFSGCMTTDERDGARRHAGGGSGLISFAVGCSIDSELGSDDEDLVALMMSVPSVLHIATGDTKSSKAAGMMRKRA